MTTAAQNFSAPGSRNVLIASSNQLRRQRWIESLHRASWPTREACGGADALSQLETSGGCRLLLLDQKLPDLDTQELVGIIESRFPSTDVVLLDAETGRAQLPLELRNSPLYHALASFESEGDPLLSSAQMLKPAFAGESGPILAIAAGPARNGEHERGAEALAGMVGTSPVMRRLYRMVRLVAPRDTTVLITGESGTGKELVAEALHRLGPRSAHPFVVVNCAAIPETLLEAELFGHTRGAFTGAVQSRVGKVHSAHGGTLLLDEIGEMPMAVQAKLLRFLENREVQRLGSSDTFRVDVRVVAATNAKLQEKVAAREFRQDLFYRLAVFPIQAPPLRERGDDVQELARFFAKQFCGESVRLSRPVMELLHSHSWPGNVRELRHALERASILLEDGNVLLPEHFSLALPLP
ncbi:MAG: sigma-54 dependent transcriptional regulator [Candidatus Korobacteraceae bacterium]|jgi:DNA-binding NtrC family response regulator